MQSDDIGMKNSSGVVVDAYIPRKCSATNRLIGPKDHAAVQLSVARVNNKGKMIENNYVTFAFCGAIRSRGGVDSAFMLLAQEHGLMERL